jgi:hypothetical protein
MTEQYGAAIQLGPDDDDHIWAYIELEAESEADAYNTIKLLVRDDVRIKYVQPLHSGGRVQ